MKPRLIPRFLMAATFVLSGAALAQMAPGDGSLNPAVLDTDGDGVVNSDELRATPDQQFSRLDRNKDGMLTAAELGTDQGAMGTDSKPTTSLTRDEFVAAVPPMIESHDVNRDGQITGEEMER